MNRLTLTGLSECEHLNLTVPSFLLWCVLTNQLPSCLRYEMFLLINEINVSKRKIVSIDRMTRRFRASTHLIRPWTAWPTTHYVIPSFFPFSLLPPIDMVTACLSKLVISASSFSGGSTASEGARERQRRDHGMSAWTGTYTPPRWFGCGLRFESDGMTTLRRCFLPT